MNQMNALRRMSLSLLLMVMMAATSFAALASTPSIAGQGDANAGLPEGAPSPTGRIAPQSSNLDLDKKLDARLVENIASSEGPFKVYVIVNDRAAANEILTASGLPTIMGIEIPELPDSRVMELSADQVVALASSPSTTRIMTYEAPSFDATPAKGTEQAPVEPPPVEDLDVDVLHGAVDAWMDGYTGAGVNIAVIDTGFDMAHPDLKDQQARYSGGPYAGWPIAYDDRAASLWADNIIGGWVANTSTPVAELGGSIDFDGRTYDVSALLDVAGNPVVSQSASYKIGYHTDANLQDLMGEPVGVLVVDAATAGVYDTVYVDILDDYSFSNDKACVFGDEISYFDYYDALNDTVNTSAWNAGDGFPDLSGGMVYWISDGINNLPGSDWIYGADFRPSSGSAVAFVGEFSYGQSHGTMTASAALARQNSMGGLLGGMAPDAKLVALPFTGDTMNTWFFAAFGADAAPGTGDEANIVSNSYGWSDTAIDAGYELFDLYATWIDLIGGQTLWCWSTGNGGPGYGTVHSIVDPVSIHVGAGTTMQYRAELGFEPDIAYSKWGDVAPFSNSGPTRQGKLNAEIIASGMYSLEPAPLNQYDYFNGLGDGSMHFQLGSGTSHATPTVAGGAALGYQAYYEEWGGWPIIDEAKSKLMAAADDMHFDPLRQGAGWLNAYEFTQFMAEMSGTETVLPASTEPVLQKSALYPGFTYGARYETFPNFLLPGTWDDTHTLQTSNFDAVSNVTAGVSGELLLKTGTDLIELVTPDDKDQWLDITSMVPASTDLLKVTMYMPLSEFDPDMNYVTDAGYMLEMHDWVDLNSDGLGWNSMTSYELFRYIVDGSDCNYNQASIKDPIARTNDGLIVRLRTATGPFGDPIGAAGIHLSVQLDYYELQTFPWMTFRIVGDIDWQPGLSIDIGPGVSAQWEVNVSVPLGTPVGTYAAAIYIDDGSRVQSVPVVINVPADDYEFEFGGTPLFDTPYSNFITGVADKGWRFEVGDWRIYWSLPSSLPPNVDSYLAAMVNWTELPTDVNMHILAPMPDIYGTPQMSPPWGAGLLMYPVVSSDEDYLGAGTFGIGTNTGRAQEVLAAPLGSWYNSWGLGPSPFAILTRCPVMSGSAAQDTISGYTTWFSMNAYQRSVYLPLSEPPSSGSIRVWYDITVPTPVEVKGSGQGPFKTDFYPSEAITQDALTGDFVTDLANAAYTRPVTVSGASLLSVMTDEVSNAPDIDLGLWRDVNGNGVAEITEPYVYMGASGSTESVSIDDPADGVYLIKVLGYDVTGSPGRFELTVLVGTPGSITATDLLSPAGAGTHWYNISFSVPPLTGTYRGIATFGFFGADDMFSVDVTIEIGPDVEPPVIEDVYPVPGSTINTSTLFMLFLVNDNVGFYSGPDWTTLSVTLDTTIDMLEISTWSHVGDWAFVDFPYALREGAHIVNIQIADLEGLWTSFTFDFYVNTVVDFLTADFYDPILSSWIMNGATVPLDNVTVRGNTEGLASIQLETNTGYYYTDADTIGSYEFTDVRLVEGVNTMSIMATIPGGANKVVTRTIISDTVCILVALDPTTPTATPTVELKGLTEHDAVVEVNGVAAIVDSDGSWSVDIDLVEGANGLWVNATDAVGNAAQRLLEVVLDTTPPSLSIDGPADGSNTSQPSTTVHGSTEAGAEVRVDGVLGSNGTAAWSATVVLAEGMNTISVVATDALGNSVVATISVEYIPPDYVTPEELAAVQAMLQDELSNLSAALAENVSYLQGLIDGLESALGENVTGLQGQIDGLSASVADDVAQLQAMIAALGDALVENRSALDSDVAALQTQITELTASLEHNVTLLQNQVSQAQNDLQDQLDELNQTTQDDINDVNNKVDDTDAFTVMLMYLALVLFAIAVILIAAVWYFLRPKPGVGSGASEQSFEEVEPQPPSDVEREFEALEREIKQDEL